MLDYNQTQNLNPNSLPATAVPNMSPVTDNTVSVEQVVTLKPKRKWWLLILVSVFGILIIGGGVYAALFTDLKYKLPFFYPKADKLVSKMYENFANLDGFGLNLQYDFNISKRTVVEFTDDNTNSEQVNFGNQNSLDGIDLEARSRSLANEYLDSFGEMVPEDFSMQINFKGDGFSFSKQKDNNQTLPDMTLALSGEAKLASVNAKLNIESIIAQDNIYYKVTDFPMVDITKGHLNEWIQVSPDADNFIEALQTYKESQEKIAVSFKNFITDTKEKQILNFVYQNKREKIADKNLAMFTLDINPENLANWLDEKSKTGPEEKNFSFFGIDVQAKKAWTAEDRQKFLDRTKKFLETTEISVGLEAHTGELMYAKAHNTVIPKATLKKFADKQFNSILILNFNNLNEVSDVKAPDNFVKAEDLEREKLNLNEEEYNDYKQAKRIINIRKKLNDYVYKNGTFPSNLSEITKLNDRNTKQPYVYSATNYNYHLTYKMNKDVDAKYKEQTENLGYSFDSMPLDMSFGHNNTFFNYTKEYWHQGENIADNYSPISDQYVSSQNYVTDKNYFDADFLLALRQAKGVKNVQDLLENYVIKNDKYPDDLAALKDVSLGVQKVVCIDLLKDAPCEYLPIDNGNGYQLKVNFSIAKQNIKPDVWRSDFKNFDFVKGENIFSNNTDQDNDGLSNVQEYAVGTNPRLSDTDGDGYSDGDEVKSGYNPLGAGKLNSQVVTPTTIELKAVTKDDWMRGDKKAKLTIVEFSDIDCPYCTKLHETMKQLSEDYKGKINWVYKHFPLTSLHPNAFKKAEAAECVGSLGGNDKFWSFLDKLVTDKTITMDKLAEVAATFGVSGTKFQECLDSGKFTAKVQDQADQAVKAGGRGTPYSVIVFEDQKIPIHGTLPYGQLKTQIDALLK